MNRDPHDVLVEYTRELDARVRAEGVESLRSMNTTELCMLKMLKQFDLEQPSALADNALKLQLEQDSQVILDELHCRLEPELEP